MERRTLVFAIAMLITALPAQAHKPVAVGQLESAADAPIALLDIDISQVLYFEPTTANPELWMSFTGTTGQELFVQPGVPRIAGLEDVRPSFALLAPGLPEIDLPFDVPAGYGGLFFSSSGAEPEPFDEPFTGTSDWQFVATRLALPQSGEYLLVAYLPGGELSKFWIAVGEREDFGLADIFTLPGITVEVRQFHEIFPLGGIALIAPIVALFLALAALFSGLFA